MTTQVTLADCPPGLFEFNGSLGFKSEYHTTSTSTGLIQADAYCLESGEYFWGGAKGKDREQLQVQPLDVSQLHNLLRLYCEERATNSQMAKAQAELAAQLIATQSALSGWLDLHDDMITQGGDVSELPADVLQSYAQRQADLIDQTREIMLQEDGTYSPTLTGSQHLDELLAKASATFAALPPEEQAAMNLEQRQSFARGQVAMMRADQARKDKA